MKKNKQTYYNKYLEKNWNNIKNTLKGFKSLTSLKTVLSSVPTGLSPDNGDTITNPYDIVNAFNNYFASIAKATKNALNIHINIFWTILGMKMVVKYFCNLLIKKK